MAPPYFKVAVLELFDDEPFGHKILYKDKKYRCMFILDIL